VLNFKSARIKGKNMLPNKENTKLLENKWVDVNITTLDLYIVVILTLLGVASIYLPPINGSVIRLVFALALALFIPGYSLIAALFPEKKSLGSIERVILSFTMSIIVVPLIGFGLSFVSWGIRLDPIMICVFVFTIVCSLIAYIRRLRLPVEERYCVDFAGAFAEAKDIFKDKSSLDNGITLLVIVATVVSLCAIGYMIFTPKIGEQYTQFYILDSNGSADDYPREFSIGEQKPVIVSISNHEQRDVNYSLIIMLSDNSTRSQLYSEQVIVDNNQTWRRLLDIKPDRPGTGMKLDFLLYADGNMTAPYQECWLWINVTDRAAANATRVVTGNMTVPATGG
jgi:uncharacterized membrane protein